MGMLGLGKRSVMVYKGIDAVPIPKALYHVLT